MVEEKKIPSSRSIHFLQQWRRHNVTLAVTNIEGLPDNVLAQILDLVSCAHTRVIVAPTVCRRWRRVARELCMTKLDLRFGITRRHHAKAPSPALLLRDRDMFALVNARFNHVRTLRIVHGILLTDLAAATIASQCPLLRELTLSHCTGLTDIALLYIGRGCQHLESVDVSGCVRITDAGVGALMVGCSGSMRNLNISRCRNLTNHALALVARFGVVLQSLNAGWCNGISDAGVAALVAKTSVIGTQLRALNLWNLHRITDDGLVALASGCPLLRTLVLLNCHKISDYGIAAIASGCPKLDSLDLYACDRVTDAGVVYISRNCYNLTNIDLGRCHRITPKGLEAAGRGGKVKVFTTYGRLHG